MKKMGFLNSIFLIIFPILINQFISAKDVLSPGGELNSTSTLVSAGGKFTLGFFTIPTTKFTYLGIWYTNDDQDRKVWVANRDIPMISNGVLMIDASGTLKVIREGGNINFNVSHISLFNVSNEVGSGNTTAVLEDSGNFVLYDVANGKQILWQSFDHPTDTLLEGMKLGYNLTTKQNWTLTSGLTDMDPASGAFTLKLEQIKNSPKLVIYWRGEVYWSSSLLENGTFQASLQELSSMQFPTTLNFISDATGMYFTYQTIGYTVSMLKLYSNGYLVDGASQILLTPIFCYGYESNDNCAISDLPTCRSQGDSFRQRRGYLSGSSINYDKRSNISVSDCMEICWNDCNCMGFNTYSTNGTGCITWIGGDKTFIPNDFKELIYVLVSEQRPKSREKTWIWVVCVVIVVALALLASLCYVCIRMCRRKVAVFSSAPISSVPTDSVNASNLHLRSQIKKK